MHVCIQERDRQTEQERHQLNATTGLCCLSQCVFTVTSNHTHTHTRQHKRAERKQEVSCREGRRIKGVKEEKKEREKRAMEGTVFH